MSEVADILNKVGEAHKLPLAQAWARCRRCSTGTEHASLTAAGTPFYLADENPTPRGLRRAPPALQQMRAHRGSGCGCRPRFCADVTKYSMDTYPLGHHTRFYSQAGCLAMCAQLPRGDDASMDMDGGGSGDRDECMLEFFLPPDCRDSATQK